MEIPMNKTDRVEVRETPAVISDNGKVRVGNFTPALPTAVRGDPTDINDSAKGMIGNRAPVPRGK